MRSLTDIQVANAMRQAMPTAPKKRPSKSLVDVKRLEKEVSALRLRALTHDRKEAASARTARAAAEDADALLEVVSLFAQTLTNEKSEWRKVRERARKLLEDRGIPPPSTLGSSRNRRKTGRKTPRAPEST